MNQAEQSARIIGAETRNEMNAKAIYDLQQEVMEQAKRIEKLEVGIAKGTTDLTGIINDICGRIECLEQFLPPV